MDRINYPHLYIVKTVNKFVGGIVEIGENLTYTIRVKNAGKDNYENDLVIFENPSPILNHK